MLAIALFFIGHWLLSIFFQTFFLHRYGSPPPIWDEPPLGTGFLLLDMACAGVVLLVTAGLRDPAPRAPRLQQYAT